MTDITSELYGAILMEPEGLIARQNSIKLPDDKVPYAMALFEVEKQKFPNFLATKMGVSVRNEIEFSRINQREAYLTALRDRTIKQAEKIRQQAKEFLNDALIAGEIKSYICPLSKNPSDKLTFKKISSKWWAGSQAFKIDGLSALWAIGKKKSYAEGLILLDRQDLVRWGNEDETLNSKPGRPRESGYDDNAHLAYMRKIIEKEHVSVNRAACLAVTKLGVKGASEEAHTARLRRKSPKLKKISK